MSLDICQIVHGMYNSFVHSFCTWNVQKICQLYMECTIYGKLLS